MKTLLNNAKLLPLLILTLFSSLALIGAEKTIVYQFDIKENIAPGVWLKLQKAYAEADSLDTDLFLIHMNTYGGTVVDADSIRTKLLNAPMPVYVFIDNNAASAGALISMACDSIFMRPGANIGAATVVNQSGEAAPDKYQSYMRSTMRATAEAAGRDTLIKNGDTTYVYRRDPKIAEAMVDESLYIAGVSDTGKVLTLTPNEAVELGMCDGIVDSVEEILERSDITDYEIVKYEETWLDKLLTMLTNPFISGIFIMAIFGGIYFELQTPGIGFALGVAILGAILYFAPLYLEGLAENWEIILFAIGVILIGVEIFVLPGFGIAGIVGMICTLAALVLALIENVYFDFDGIDMSILFKAVLQVSIAFTLGISLVLYLGKRFHNENSALFKAFALTDSQEKEEGYTVSEERISSLVGKTGIAYTVLRPSGKVQIDNNFYDAMCVHGMIEKGTEIKVVKHEAGQVYVEALKC